MLEGLAELFGQVFALPVKLFEVGFALAQALVEAAEGVFERCLQKSVQLEVCGGEILASTLLPHTPLLCK